MGNGMERGPTRARIAFKKASEGVPRLRMNSHVLAWEELMGVEWASCDADEPTEIDGDADYECPWFSAPILAHWMSLDGWRTLHESGPFEQWIICLICGNSTTQCIC